MLRELSVQNLALIEDVRVELEDGYCAWTGETGAGKSLLLTALGLVLGGKASADLIRSGKTEARAAAVFEITDPDLRADVEAVLGGSLEDEQLVLTRRLSSQGRGSAQVNGLPVAVTTLQKLAKRWLTSTVSSRGERCSTRTISASCSTRMEIFKDWFATIARRDRLTRRCGVSGSRSTIRRRCDSVNEPCSSSSVPSWPRPIPGPANTMSWLARHDGQKCAEQIRAAAASGYSALYESDHSAQGLLTRVARTLEPLTRAAPELTEAARVLVRLADETREVAFTLRDLGHGCGEPPTRLEDLETRMALVPSPGGEVSLHAGRARVRDATRSTRNWVSSTRTTQICSHSTNRWQGPGSHLNEQPANSRPPAASSQATSPEYSETP